MNTEWINTNDRLPEKEGVYVVAVSNNDPMDFKNYDKGLSISTDNFNANGNWVFMDNKYVKYWMDIPLPQHIGE